MAGGYDFSMTDLYPSFSDNLTTRDNTVPDEIEQQAYVDEDASSPVVAAPGKNQIWMGIGVMVAVMLFLSL